LALVHVTVQAWLSAFLFTQAVEIPVYVLAIRHALREGHAERPRRLSLQIALAFGASAVTHPVVWFVIPRLAPSFSSPGAAYLEYVARAETFALVVEAFYFHSFRVVRMPRALVWSLLANGLSASAGFLSRSLFGWP
jgi:hypothetical protein